MSHTDEANKETLEEIESKLDLLIDKISQYIEQYQENSDDEEGKEDNQGVLTNHQSVQIRRPLLMDNLLHIKIIKSLINKSRKSLVRVKNHINEKFFKPY